MKLIDGFWLAMVLKKKCAKCSFEYDYESFANLILFCPNCGNYDFLECEYGYGPVVPCRIYYGNKVVGMVTASEGFERRYRVDSDVFDVHRLLQSSYLDALYEAKDIISELIKES